MSWRRQLPAYSPLPLEAVMAGTAGLSGGAEAAREALVATLSARYTADRVLLTDSGTSALTLAIRGALAGSRGAPVALPAYCCYDVATAALGAEALVRLYDVDPLTLAPGPGALEAAFAQGARAAVLVHLYGVPVDPEAARAAARGARALLIEDAAQGAGARWRGRPLGSFGDLTVLSFGRGKGVTGGRGGALLARGAPGAEALERSAGTLGAPARGLAEAVQLGAQWLLGRPSLYRLPASLPFLRLGETVYHTPSPPRQLSAVAARALAAAWAASEREAEVRRKRAARLLARAAQGLAPIRVPADGEAGYLRLPFVASEDARTEAGTGRARALGIMPGYPAALCDLPGFGDRVLNHSEAMPGARRLAQRLVTIPAHGLLSEADLAALERWVGERRR